MRESSTRLLRPFTNPCSGTMLCIPPLARGYLLVGVQDVARPSSPRAIPHWLGLIGVPVPGNNIDRCGGELVEEGAWDEVAEE
jgi:hypothetical protein